MRLYHLSYDTIDCKKHFKDDYDEARRYLLCVLAHTPIQAIESYCESTMILHYEDSVKAKKLFKYLEDNLSEYFYFSVSQVARNENNEHFIYHNPNHELDNNLGVEWDNLSCNNLKKHISAF